MRKFFRSVLVIGVVMVGMLIQLSSFGSTLPKAYKNFHHTLPKSRIHFNDNVLNNSLFNSTSQPVEHGKILYWFSPGTWIFISDKPGKTLSGKDFIPEKPLPKGMGGGLIQTIPSADSMFGIKIVKVKYKGLLSEITSKTGIAADVFTIPRSAVIQTAEGARVIQALNVFKYRVVPVKVASESGDKVTVSSGLKEGDEIVVSARFLAVSQLSTKQSNKSKSADEQTFIVMAIIKNVDTKNRTVELSHSRKYPLQPSFIKRKKIIHVPVAKNVNLLNVKSGDEVHLILVRTKDNGYVITKLDVVKY